MRPFAVPTLKTLPYDGLIWEEFERLCTTLFAKKFDHLKNVRGYLSGGHKQQGIDIRGFDPVDGRYVYVQCKKVKKFTASDVEKAVSLFEQGEFYEESKIFYLCVTSEIDQKYEAVLSGAEKRFARDDKSFIIWDQKALDLILKDNPEIVFDVFDRGGIHSITELFIGQEKFKQLLHVPERRIYSIPDLYVPRKLSHYDTNSKKLMHHSITDAIANNPKHILLKSPATIGKTIELEYAAFYFSTSRDKNLFPILVSLKNYISQSFDELLVNYFSEKWRDVPPSQLLILLDGFDEVRSGQRDIFLSRLGEFIEANPGTKVLLSSRINFVADNALFDGFAEYTLDEFTSDDIAQYVNITLDEPDRARFNEYTVQNNIGQWLQSPYNLANLIVLYKEDPTNLPKTQRQLLERIIDTNLQRDCEKYRIDILHKREHLTTLRKLAFSYNLYGVNSVSLLELSKIFSGDEIGRIRRSSIIKFGEDSITFNHNVLQEYLSAQVLKDQGFDKALKILTFKPTHETIKPKWFNTIGMLIDQLQDQPDYLNELILFVGTKEPTVLNFIEYSFIHPDTRFQIFKKIISNTERFYKDRDIDRYKLAQIGGIYENGEVVEYLIELMKISDGEDIQKQQYVRDDAIECIRYIVNKDIWYDKEELASIFEQLITHQQVERYTKALCYKAMSEFEFYSEHIVSISLLNLQKADSFELKDDILGYLNGSPQFEDYGDLYVSHISEHEQYKQGNRRRLSGAGNRLLKGLYTFKQSKNLHKILSYLIDNVDKIFATDSLFVDKSHDKQSFFLKFSERLIAAYKVDKTIYDHTLEFLQEAKLKGYEKGVNGLANFFLETGTNKKAFWQLWNDRKNKNFSSRHVAAFMIDDEIMQTFKDNFIKKSINKKDIWSLIQDMNFAGKHDIAEQFRFEMNSISKNVFQYEKQIDYQAINENKSKQDVKLLMNKKLFVREVLAFFEYYKKKSLTQDEIIAYRRYWNECNNHVAGSFLNSWFTVKNSKRKKLYKKHVIDWLESSPNWWRWYVINELYSYDAKHMTPSSLAHIRTWCKKIDKEINFNTAIEDGEGTSRTVRWNELYYTNFFLKKDIEVSDERQLEMLSFDWSHNIKPLNSEPEETLTEKIIRLQGEEAVKNQLVQNLRDNKVSFYVLENHVRWCKDLGVKEGVPYMANLIKSNWRSESFFVSSVLKTYLELGGDIRAFSQVFTEFCPSFKFHWEILSEMAEKKVFKGKLKTLLLPFIMKLPDDEDTMLKASKLLIKIGDMAGLSSYIEWYKSINPSPQDEFFTDLDAYRFSDIFDLLIGFLEDVVTKDLNNTRRTNPIQEIILILKSKAFEKETYFTQCLAALRIIEQSDSLLFDNMYALKRNINFFEKEYYLEKADYERYEDVVTDLLFI